MKTIVMMLLLLVPMFQVSAEDTSYEAGVHYLEIANPIETNLENGQSGEVLVFFKYTCPACYQLHPYIESWESTLDDGVVVRRIPVFQPDIYSKAFYAADLFNLDDAFHEAVYQQIHLRRQPLRSLEEFAQLASGYGGDEARFISTANSFVVDMKVNQGNKIAAQARVPGTPYMVVNGKYLLSGRMAGSNEGMLKVADYLLSKEKNERTFIGDQSSPIFSRTLADK